jgi:bacillolysin
MKTLVTNVILAVTFLIGITVNSNACNIPTGLNASNITATSAVLSWTAVSGASGYHVSWQEINAGFWFSANTTANSLTVGGYPVGLKPNTTYHFMVYAVCDQAFSVNSSLFKFKTLPK